MGMERMKIGRERKWKQDGGSKDGGGENVRTGREVEAGWN